MKFAVAILLLGVSAAYAQNKTIADVLEEQVCYGKLDNGSSESDSKGGVYMRFDRSGEIKLQAILTPAAFNNPRKEINPWSSFGVRHVDADDGKVLKLTAANYNAWTLQFDPRTRKLTGTADPRQGRGGWNRKVWNVELTCGKQ